MVSVWKKSHWFHLLLWGASQFIIALFFHFYSIMWNAIHTTYFSILAHFASQDESIKNNVGLSNSKIDSSNNHSENIDKISSSLLPTQHSSRSLTNLNFASSQRVTYRRLEKIASYHYLPRVVYHGSLKKSQSHHR